MKFCIILFVFIHSSLFSSQHILEQMEFEAFQYSCVEEQSQKVCDLKGFVFDSATQEIVSFMSFNVNPDGLTQLQIALPHAVNLLPLQAGDEGEHHHQPHVEIVDHMPSVPWP